METKAIFSDNRNEYLEHYGVPGMKWGIRNAETQRKYAGKYVEKSAKYQQKSTRMKLKAYKADQTLLGRSKTTKYAKNMAKAAKYSRKANRSLFNKEGNAKKAEKYLQRAQKSAGNVAKVTEFTQKAVKYEYKSEKFKKKAEKALAKAEAWDARTVAKAKAAGKEKVLKELKASRIAKQKAREAFEAQEAAEYEAWRKEHPYKVPGMSWK